MKIVSPGFLIAILLLLFCEPLYAQQERQKIIAAFDSVIYYADSTIVCAYKTKHGRLNGYSIEFDSTGAAIYIGKYKNGYETGQWRCNDGSSTFYEKKGQFTMLPGCGTGINLAQKDFEKLYFRLINQEK
ncbi:MAG: hypothetical protein M3R17_00630 [Bacteroidota bacterium]|nr:hypothetical protein [Bacteroidota bacterium]